MTNASKEFCANLCKRLRSGNAYMTNRQQADFIEALAAERDAATKRADAFACENESLINENATLEMEAKTATERAEKAEAEARDVRAAVHALERDHEADLARMQKEIEGWQAERNVARQDQEAAQARVAALEGALREHHNWHLNAGTWGIKGDDGVWIEIDLGAEYGDSALCEHTVAALSASPAPAVSQAAADVLADLNRLAADEEFARIDRAEVERLDRAAQAEREG